MQSPRTGNLPPLLLLALLSLLLYAALPSKGYHDDDMYYAMSVRAGDPRAFLLGQPHYYFWTSLGAAAYALCLRAGLPATPHGALAGLNALLGFAGLAAMYLLQRRVCGLGRAAAFLGSLFLGLGFGYWNSAVSAGKYALETVFLIPAFFLILETARRDSIPVAARCGACIGLALLSQMVDLLLFPVMLLFFLLAGGLSGGRARRLLVCLLVALSLAGAGLSAMGWFLRGHRSFGALIGWLTAYPVREFVHFHPANLLMVLAGNARAVWGIGFVKSFMLGKTGPLAFGAVAALVAAGSGALLFLAVARPARRGRCAGAAALAFAWIVVFSAFFGFYSPGQPKFYTRNLVPAAVLFGLAWEGLPAGDRLRRGCALAAVACLLLANLFGTILPQAAIGHNDDTTYARFILARTEADGVLIFPGAGESSVPLQVRYFGRREVIELLPGRRAPDALDRRIRAALAEGLPCYLVGEDRAVASYHWFKPVRERVRGVSPAAEATRRFFAGRGYALAPHARYEAAGDYRGNEIHRVSRVADPLDRGRGGMVQ
ncbi:MAG: hypothetical protein PHN82_08380 [bacterium]|nr:hypothetical protein [bacterium]